MIRETADGNFFLVDQSDHTELAGQFTDTHSQTAQHTELAHESTRLIWNRRVDHRRVGNPHVTHLVTKGLPERPEKCRAKHLSTGRKYGVRPVKIAK